MNRTILVLCFSLVLSLSLFTGDASGDSQGPFPPSLVVSVPASGSPWASPGSAVGSDDAYATASGLLGLTDTLAANFFGGSPFSIPPGSTIDGILVTIEQSGSLGLSIVDFSVFLTVGVGPVGLDHATATSLPPGPPDLIIPYGGAADLWGAVWTPALINGTTWGVAYNAFDSFAIDTLQVDDIAFTVFFTPPPPVPAASTGMLALTALLVALGGVVFIRPWQGAMSR